MTLHFIHNSASAYWRLSAYYPRMAKRWIRGARCAVAVLAVLPALAQPRIGLAVSRPAKATDAVAAIRRETWDDSKPTVDVIVELRDVPLFVRGPGRAEASARSDVQADLDRLAGDLRRIGQRAPAEAAAKALSAADDPVRIRRTYTRLFVGASARVRKEMLPAIRSLPYVTAVHLDLTVHALSEEGVEKIGANEVWEQLGTKGAGVVVAVIDTGIDYTHPALGGGLGPGFKVIGGWDFVNDDADPMDDSFHGTHVAGIIAANGVGLTGVAPEASLLAYKVLDQNGQGKESDILAALERMVDPNGDGDPSDHVAVANLSFGLDGASASDPMAVAVGNAVAAGVVVCVAAGNTGAFHDIGSPALAPAAITVGASSLDDVMASFSSRGPTEQTQLIKPEVVAPGVAITSTTPGGGTLVLSGTSMATPHVAGVAALLLALHHDWSPEEVKSAIVTTAVPLPGEVMEEGAGRVDALRAATVDVLAAPPVLSFGMDDAKQDVWTASTTMILRNSASHTTTLTAAVTGAGTGIDVTATPASLTLQPGESGLVVLRLRVSNAAVPAPDFGSLSFGGSVVFTGAAAPLHVPWAFVKAADLTVRCADPSGSGGLDTLYLADVHDPFAAVYRFGSPGSDISLTVPIGTYDVVLDRIDNASTQFDDVIVLENRDLSGLGSLDLGPEMAPFSVTVSAKDETGADLDSLGRTCALHTGMVLQNGTAFDFPAQWSRVPDRFSALSPSVTLYVDESCQDVTKDGLALVHTLHVAQAADALQGLQQSVVLPIDSPWIRQDIRMIPQPQPATFFAMWGAPCWRFSFLSSCHASLTGMPLSGTVETGTIYLTDHVAPHRAAVAFAALWSGVDGVVTSPEIWAENGEVVLHQWPTPEPNIYRVPPGSVLTFGDSPIFPRSGIGMENGQFACALAWQGPAGEERSLDATLAANTLFDDAGKVVRQGQLAGPPLPPGAYRVQSVNRDYMVGGVPGSATFTASFDTRGNDGYPPTLTALRVLDGSGVQSSSVPSGSAAALVFSAEDISDLTRTPDPLPDQSERVAYRAHGTTDWHSLSPVVVALDYVTTEDLGHPPSGTLFRADLSAVTATMSGLIDIRMQVQDLTGNAIELLLEPAFAVAKPRSHAVRH